MKSNYKLDRYAKLHNVLTRLKEEFPSLEIIPINEAYAPYGLKEFQKTHKCCMGFKLPLDNVKLYGRLAENPFFQQGVMCSHKKSISSYAVGKDGVGDDGWDNCHAVEAFSLGTSLIDENWNPLTEEELYEHLRDNFLKYL